MAKKKVKAAAKRKTAKKAAPLSGGAKEFVDHLEKNPRLRAGLRKAWSDVLSQAKKKGFKFTRDELRRHMANRYKLTDLVNPDEPDTCICI